jgi:hypothetical protein
MNVEIDDILEQIARAQSAWDQYNIQSRLPTDPRSLVQGHLWDAFNNGHRSAQARRDPAASSAAWNALEHALLELTNVANRLGGRAHSRSGRLTPTLPNDRRRVQPRVPDRSEGTANRITLSFGDLDACIGSYGTCGRGALHGGAGREPRRCPRRMTARMRCRRPR